MKLQQLRYFKAACQYSSLTTAAKALHVSQPSISTAIHELEREFDIQLMERRYQGFTLTAEGKALWEMSEGLLRHVSQLEQRMTDLGKKQVPLRIGVSPMAGVAVLTELYAGLLPRHPQLTLSTEEAGTNALLGALLENTLDMAFVSHYSPLPPEFLSIPVMATETKWCTASQHPAARRASVRIEELAEEELVLYQDSFTLHNIVLDRFRRAGVQPRILHETSQLSMIYALIQAGIATGFLMESVAYLFPGLSWIPLDLPLSATISLVWERQRSLSRDMCLLTEHYAAQESGGK